RRAVRPPASGVRARGMRACTGGAPVRAPERRRWRTAVPPALHAGALPPSQRHPLRHGALAGEPQRQPWMPEGQAAPQAGVGAYAPDVLQHGTRERGVAGAPDQEADAFAVTEEEVLQGDGVGQLGADLATPPSLVRRRESSRTAVM